MAHMRLAQAGDELEEGLRLRPWRALVSPRGDLMRRVLLTLLLCCAPLPAPAEEPLSAADARAVREVIEAQLDAFRRDDAPRAFSYASTGIRATFRTPEIFIEMVRTSYAVVYRPRSVRFERPVLIDGEVVQPVLMTDAEGRAWLALYPMQREADAGWRINGCRLARLKAAET
jgi:hypothetical protein